MFAPLDSSHGDGLNRANYFWYFMILVMVVVMVVVIGVQTISSIKVPLLANYLKYLSLG